MSQPPLQLTEGSLNGQISWPVWFLVFFIGFLTGASLDLGALWLFHHWMNR